MSITPSLSLSSSQASPVPSPSRSDCVGFHTDSQLSSQAVRLPPVQWSKVPSPSFSRIPSLSASLSQASPVPS